MGKGPLSQRMSRRWDGMEAGPTWKKPVTLLGSFAANFGVGYVLLSLRERGRTQSSQPLLHPLQQEERFCWETTAPAFFPTAKEMRAGVFKLLCRAVGQHGICSSQNGVHSGVWRERMFGCRGFVYARSLAG